MLACEPVSTLNLTFVPCMSNTVFTLSAITQTASISHLLARVYITVIKASCHEMLRMALNRHELARYRRQRKQGLLTQLALI